MKHLLMSTAIVGLVALPGFAIAQSDQANETTTQEQTQTDGQTGAGAETGAGTGSGSDMEGGAQSGTGSDMDSESSMGGSTGTGSEGSSDMGGTSQSGSGDDQSGSSMGSTGTDTEESSRTGTGSDNMTSGDKPAVAEGHSEVDPNTVEASKINGAPVMSREGDKLANVSEVLMTQDGSIKSIVVNVGGVLGIGSKPVEVPFDKVTLQTNDQDGDMSIILPMSQQELENMPEYRES